MFGNNPIRQISNNDGTMLDVQNIFLTIQGEGPCAGIPAIFIRLGGCNLACKFCDTEFESFKLISLKQIMEEVFELKADLATNLIVITGGEPFRQNISPLCDELIKNNFLVQIETNGTLFRPLNPMVSIVCSPKASKLGYAPIREDLLVYLDAFKFIISQSQQNYSQVPDMGQKKHRIAVYLQPMDEYDENKNAQNTILTIKLCQQYGYRLSLQTHKFIGIE